jgi:hypothetical protein
MKNFGHSLDSFDYFDSFDLIDSCSNSYLFGIFKKYSPFIFIRPLYFILFWAAIYY